MIVVSDTTPLITLIKAGQLNLLNKLFGEILIPAAVHKELTANENYFDEARGRRVAMSMGLEIIGSIGILVSACKKGYLSINEAKEAFNKIRKSNRHISNSLIQDALDIIAGSAFVHGEN